MENKAISSYVDFWKKFVDFEGKANRPEFWWPFLFNMLLSVVVGVIWQPLATVVSLVVLIPSLSVAVRRLQDINKSWTNLFWLFLPLVGWIILIVFWARK